VQCGAEASQKLTCPAVTGVSADGHVRCKEYRGSRSNARDRRPSRRPHSTRLTWRAEDPTTGSTWNAGFVAALSRKTCLRQMLTYAVDLNACACACRFCRLGQVQPLGAAVITGSHDVRVSIAIEVTHTNFEIVRNIETRNLPKNSR